MISAWQNWDANAQPTSQKTTVQKMTSALNAFGGIAAHENFGPLTLIGSRSDAPAAQPVALLGHIDQTPRLANELGVLAKSQPMLYFAAWQRWGERVDQRISGNYAAILQLPDGRLRLSRSAWDAPPLHFANDAERAIVSPLLRVLFAAGVPKQLDYDRVIDQLAYDFREEEIAGWYRGINTVPLGTAITLSPDGIDLNEWYSVASIEPVGSITLEDAADQAYALLREAAGEAVAADPKFALSLSGGLDSPITAAALLGEMGSDATLDAITFRPDSEWDGATPDGVIGDEWPIVSNFADMHPQIRLHAADPEQGGFDYRSREMLSAMQLFAPGLANVGMYHGVYAKARELGCNTLFNADLGNQSFSNDGRWAYVEYARTGKWGELAQLLANKPADTRPLWRKLAALSILPQLPAPLRKTLRKIVHPQRASMTAHLSLLAPSALERRNRERGSKSVWNDLTYPRTRMEAAEADHHDENGEGADVALAFEQIYGVRRRDVTAYRPLLEFCIGLQTEHFASGGTHRLLARTMAKGRLPEQHRLSARHGQHNVDWITRMGRQKEQYIAACDIMRGHPYLSEILDLDRITHLLEDWPKQQSFDIDNDWPRMMGIPRAILAAQMIAIVEGRNDL